MRNRGKLSVQFGAFEFDPESGELCKAGVPLKLQPQPARVLALLLNRPGEIITREELQQKIWGNETFVDFERGLNFCIKQIRDVLGDDADAPRYIETLPKRGYRFLARVEERARTRVPRLALALVLGALLLGAGYLAGKRFGFWRASLPHKTMLVVLPFDNLNRDQEQEYFSNGLTEEMTTELGRLQPERLGVIARTTALHYKNLHKPTDEIARELGVDYILEGSVRRAGDRVRITAQLIQTSDQTHVWADSYERPLQDIFALQSDIAQAIARQIQLQLTPAQQARLASSRRVVPEAFDDYLRGRYHWNKRDPESLRRSVVNFELAIRKDPTYAPAYAGLADAYRHLGTVPYDGLPPRQAMPRAKAAALKALEIDDTLAEAHASLGALRQDFDWDWAGAEQEFQRALALNPHYPPAHQWYGLLLLVTGKPEKGLEEIQRAVALDPLNLVINESWAQAFYYVRQYDRLIVQCRQILDLEPNRPLPYFYIGLAYVQKGMPNEAWGALEKAKMFSGGSPAMVMAVGYSQALAGHQDRTRQALEELRTLSRRRYVPALYWAAIYTGLGDKDRAFAWLEKAFEERSDYLAYLNLEPMADNLRSDPRFQQLLHRIGLKP